MIAVLGILGFSSMIGQIALMRELVAVFYGNELVFGLILAWWLLWEATGAWGLGRWAERRSRGRRALTASLTLAALALPLQMILTRSIRDLLAITPGTLVSLNQMVWAIGLVLAPYCLAHGLAFSLVARLLATGSSSAKPDGGLAGRAYAYESIGAVTGGALFSFLLVGHLNPFQIILATSTVTLVIVVQYSAPKFRFSSSVLGHWPWVILALSVAIILTLPLGAWLDHQTLVRQWPNLVFAADSRYGRLTITALGDQRVFYENGLLAFETESTFPEEVVHLPMLAHPAPQRVLLIGGGVSGDLTELFKHNPNEVIYLELDPLIIEAAQTHLPAQQAAALNDSRLTRIYRDGRRYAKENRDPFDVVILDLPEPSTGQLNRFYTLEFFEEIKGLLAEGGVFSLGLPSAENYWNPELIRRNASVYHTLLRVFPTVLVTPGDHNFFLATADDAFPGPGVLGQRLTDRAIETRWVTPEYIQFLLTGDRFGAAQADLLAAGDVKLNQDLTPICYFYSLALWVSRFGSHLQGLFETTSLLRLGWLVLPLLVGLGSLWGHRRAVSLALVGGTGLAGMSLQIVLLLAFQALYGYAYEQVGLLVAAFMGGLALGAGLISRRSWTVSRRWPWGVQVAQAAYALGLAASLALELPLPSLSFPLLAGVAGGLTGAVFPLAAALSQPASQTGRTAGLLYGADLLGGCVGALATSIVLVPVLGVVQTCLAAALVATVDGALTLSITKKGDSLV